MSPLDPGANAASLEAENEALLEFLYVAPVGLMEISPVGAISIMNPRAAQILMPITGAAGAANLFEALEKYAPDLRLIATSFGQPRGTICERRRIHVGSGSHEDAQILACSLIKIDESRTMAVINDITQEVAQERQLKQVESWFSAILSGVKDFALLSLNAQGRVRSWNASGERLTGYAAEKIVGHTLNVMYPPDAAVQGRALQQIDHARRSGWHIDEGWRKRADGSRFWCQSLVSAMEEATGEITGYSVVLRDVTERKTTADEVRRLLTTDQLTGLSNRAHFFDLAESELDRWTRFGHPLTALMIDIDHFKSINDTHGHAGGDIVLRSVADFFRANLRSIDIVGRLGGEEFSILMPSTDIEGGRLIAEMIRCGIAASPVLVDGKPVQLTISIGCAQLSAGLASIDGVLKAADGALYAAKRDGRNRVTIAQEQTDGSCDHQAA